MRELESAKRVILSFACPAGLRANLHVYPVGFRESLVARAREYA